MKTVCALPRRLFTRSRSVSNVMYPSPSIASKFNRRVAELVHYFLGVALLTASRPGTLVRHGPEQSESVDSRPLACAASRAAHPWRCPGALPHRLGPAARRLGGGG